MRIASIGRWVVAGGLVVLPTEARILSAECRRRTEIAGPLLRFAPHDLPAAPACPWHGRSVLLASLDSAIALDERGKHAPPRRFEINFISCS